MAQSTRRSFLKKAGAATIAAPLFVRNLMSQPPSRRVRHASFGADGMAGSDIGSLTSHPNLQLVCVADVDTARQAGVRKRFADRVNYYQDWRVLLDKEAKGLDSVNVSTPDHMHAPIAMAAMQLGLHAYVQKPLAHDIYECRRLAEVARDRKLITQMGIQVHSALEYRLAVRLVQDGAIGRVREVHTWSNKKWGDPNPLPDRKDAVPATLDWDLWLGVALSRSFLNGYYHPGNWRKRLDFGTGTFGDMGCHIYDPCFAALALTAPISVRSEGPAPPNRHNWANDAIIHYVFPGTRYTTDGTDVRVTWYDGDQRPPREIQALLGAQKVPDQGSILIGAKGVMLVPHVGRPVLLPERDFREFRMPQVQGANHYHQFVNAILGEGRTSAAFDYSGPLTEAVLLGGVATNFPNTTLGWDSAKLAFRNSADATRLVRRTYRKGWNVNGLS